MVAESRYRVNRHTAYGVNQRIRRQMRANIECFINASAEDIEERLKELDAEWDTERTLEANAASLSLLGLFLGRTVSRKFYLLPTAVAAFLLQHAVQGWCPPLPILRRMGVRTPEEIDAERYALKLIRGDFRMGEASDSGRPDIDVIMEAVDANLYFKQKPAREERGMPTRDTSGVCVGECRDRAREGEEERQAAIEVENVETPETSTAPGAGKRKDQPGVLGGHV